MIYSNNKKGMSELVSYLLLTFLIVTVASITFVFAQNYLESIQQQQDYSSMETHLKKISYSINEILSFNNETITYFISFSTGQIEFENQTLLYLSQRSYQGNNTCLDIVCYGSREDYGTIYFNLSNNYSFASNTTLIPGEYFIEFKHNKKGDEIEISVKQ